MNKWILTLLFLLCAPLRAVDYPDFIEQVFLTQDQALTAVFPKAQKIVQEKFTLTAAQKEKIENTLGWEISENEFVIFRSIIDGKKQGYALITNEIGKFKPITFIVKTDNDKKLDRVEVMVYREAVGAEVQRQRFLRQFRGKNSKNALRINRDIINVTGATMSVQAVTLGVKKTLLLLDTFYPNEK